MRTLTRYIGRDVLFSTLAVFAALLSLFAFFDLVNELSDVGKGGYTISAAMIFVALHLPSRVYELFPVAALIGTLFGLAQLVANSEYTVMRASGASLWQVGWAVVRVGVLLAALTFLAGEFVAPPAERLAQTIRVAAKGETTRVFAQQFSSGFWFRQDRMFVNIRTVMADLSIAGIRIYEFDDAMRLTAARSAEAGRFVEEGRWELTDVKSTQIAGDVATATSAPTWIWHTVLRPSLLTVYKVAPERLELAAHFQRRQGGVGFRIFTGTMLGLAFFLIGRLFSSLGVLNDWPPLVSAVAPLMVFTSVAIGMLLWIERR